MVLWLPNTVVLTKHTVWSSRNNDVVWLVLPWYDTVVLLRGVDNRRHYWNGPCAAVLLLSPIALRLRLHRLRLSSVLQGRVVAELRQGKKLSCGHFKQRRNHPALLACQAIERRAGKSFPAMASDLEVVNLLGVYPLEFLNFNVSFEIRRFELHV